MNDERRTGFGDSFALWASLGASLYLMPFGALLVPELSIAQAVAAALLAAILASLLVAALVGIAARTGRTTLGLLSGPLGDRGRAPLAGLLATRHLLFTLFALVLIADSATLLGERALGADLRPLWVILFAAAAFGALLAARRWPLLRRIVPGLIVVLALGITLSAYMEFEIPSYLRRPSPGGWPEFWQAVNLMLIFPLLWLPVAGDHSEGADPRRASLGALAGLALSATWFGILGIVYLPATDSGDIPGFLVGMQLGLGALLILMVLQLDEVFVSAQSLGVVARDLGWSAGAVVPALSLLAVVPFALFLHVGDLEGYALLCAALFIPAFAVVAAHSLRPGDQPIAVPIVAWAAGFVLYQWIAPSDIGWWQDTLEWLTGRVGVAFPLSEESDWLGPVIPSFLLAFTVQLLAGIALPRRESGSLRPAPG